MAKSEKMKIKEQDKEEEKCNKELPEKEDEEAKKTAVDDKEEDLEKKEDEEDEDEEKKKKKMKKGDQGGENPQEDTASATDANSSISPKMGVPSTQDVFVPQSGVKVSREQPQYPNEVQMSGSQSGNIPSYGKSVNVELTKSPLFIELSKQINGMQNALGKKLEAVEKSYTDRIANLQKSLDKFYSQPFYKSIDDAQGPEGIQKMSIKEQISKGKIEIRGN